MASPAFGLNNQQTQNWANSFQNNLRKQGQDPAQFGFGGGSAFTQGGQQPSQRPPAKQPQNFSAYSQPSTKQASPFAQYNPQQMGNFAQQQMGLPSFQFTATDSFGNTYNNPAALTAQQGAMAQALNAQRAQQIQSGNIGRLNPMAAYQQAQNMVQGGWTNPFAQPPAQQQFAGLYAPGTDMSTLPFTDTLEPNPLYRPPALPGGQGQAQPQPSPDAYYPGDVFFPPAGQAQPIQPPSQGSQYGTGIDRRLKAPPAPPQSQAAPPRSYADERRAQDQAAYEELMQQIRMGGGSMADNMRADRRRADLEKKLGISPSPAVTPAAPPPPRQANPNTPTFGVYPSGTVSSPDSPVPAPSRPAPQGQAQPIQPPSPGTPYGQPSWRPKYGEYSPTMYYNDAGEMFSGSMSFAPGTSEADRSKAYGDWAERQGYFKRGPDGSKSPRQDTQYGTPPDQRGMGRTHQFIDSDGDGVDDRDQDGPGMPRYGAPPRRGTFERDAVGMPILRAPQVWTNPSDPEWLKRELQSKPDTRPVVWDEANRRYIKNPYLAGGPARPDAAAPLQRYEPGFAYARR